MKFSIFWTVALLTSLYSQAQSTTILLQTTKGDIVLTLYDETPKHRDNFLKLIKEKTLDSTLFHRVIKDFMIQGGDITSKNAGPLQQLGSGSLPYMIDAEIMADKYFHKKGALAAARNNNPKKASSANQFYIVQGKQLTMAEIDKLKSAGKRFSPAQIEAYTTLGGTPQLDGNYTVFGEVLSGFEIVDDISKVNTRAGDRPVEDIRILNITVL